jgi:predicted N-acetyltransferase YhbS
MKKYNHKDFIRIRDFLVETYAHYGKLVNWTLERWNFSISAARIMNGISLDAWESQISIWEHNREIIAVVNAEGENDGEAFFQLGSKDTPDAVLQEMFAFTESHLGIVRDGKRIIFLSIAPIFTHVEEIAAARGFIKLEDTSPYAELIIDQVYPVVLPDGFRFVDGHHVKAEDKGTAHAKAFGYYNEGLFVERSAVAFAELRKTPDYRPDLDIHIVSPHNDIASFATMWYDQRNKIGILEPLGTIPQYRKMGLGRLCIQQLANQIQQEGASKVLVGSDLEFYLRVGFHAHTQYGIWKKVIG